MNATPHTILYRFFWNFAHVFSMVWKCACSLDIFLALIFVTFSTSMKMYRQWVPSKRNCLYNFIPTFLQLCTSFFQGSKMCIWFGFYHAINFWHFSSLLTLSLFNFSQVRHQLRRSSIYISVLRTVGSSFSKHTIYIQEPAHWIALETCATVSLNYVNWF